MRQLCLEWGLSAPIFVFCPAIFELRNPLFSTVWYTKAVTNSEFNCRRRKVGMGFRPQRAFVQVTA